MGQWHLAVGWWSIAVFAGLGLTLELLHGFKVPIYLDASNETRRLMWTLAHAHGTLLGVIHIAFALSLPALSLANPRLVSRSLAGSTLSLPMGFFMAGVKFYAGDPGFGVVLVPFGAILLIFSAVSIATGIRKKPS